MRAYYGHKCAARRPRPATVLMLCLLVALAPPCDCSLPYGDTEALAHWCANAPSPFATAGLEVGNDIVSRAAAAARCYMLMAKEGGASGRRWHNAGESCRAQPALPAGAVGHLALVPSDWLAQRLVDALGMVASGTACAWVGLKHFNASEGAPAAGWYHEPHSAQWSAHLQRFDLGDAATATPWREGEPAGGHAACLKASESKLRAYGNVDTSINWICEYHYSGRRPHRFYKVPGAGDQWPAQSAHITAKTVRKQQGVIDCSRLCAADRFCAGFAVHKATGHCVTAYEVHGTAAMEDKAGYDLYEKIFVAA